VRIHSICLVKNEGDVVVESLTAASRWSDFIYVYDNGSTDGTWEKVLDLAKRLPQVVPYKQDDRPFDDGLRHEPFAHYRHRAEPGDWWCLALDADEIYIDSPKEFLAGIPMPFDVVWLACFQYYFTERDVALFHENPALYADQVPVEQKCRYYVNNWSEPGFFRYGRHLRWDSGRLPRPLRHPSPRRIRMKHYQYRSPAQIEMRLRTRRAAMARGIFVHETQTDWKSSVTGQFDPRRAGARLPESWTERIVDSSTLIYDNGDDYLIDERMLPRISNTSPSFLGKVRNRIVRTLTPPALRRG
jgi:hypothetical protein